MTKEVAEKALEKLAHRAEAHAVLDLDYDRGYSDGESSREADYSFLLTDGLDMEGVGLPWAEEMDPMDAIRELARRYKAVTERLAELEAQVERLQEVAGEAYQFVGQFLDASVSDADCSEEEVVALMDKLAEVTTSPAKDESTTSEEHEG